MFPNDTKAFQRLIDAVELFQTPYRIVSKHNIYVIDFYTSLYLYVRRLTMVEGVWVFPTTFPSISLNEDMLQHTISIKWKEFCY